MIEDQRDVEKDEFIIGEANKKESRKERRYNNHERDQNYKFRGRERLRGMKRREEKRGLRLKTKNKVTTLREEER